MAMSGVLRNCCVAPANKTQNFLLDTMTKISWETVAILQAGEKLC